jgi:hypothetical protein
VFSRHTGRDDERFNQGQCVVRSRRLTIRHPSQGGHAATQQGPMQAVSH